MEGNEDVSDSNSSQEYEDFQSVDLSDEERQQDDMEFKMKESNWFGKKSKTKTFNTTKKIYFQDSPVTKIIHPK